MIISSLIVVLVSCFFFVYLKRKEIFVIILFIKVPDECQNEVVGIESFYSCLTRRYNACPIFFTGSLQDACEEAFSSTVVKEVRSL